MLNAPDIAIEATKPSQTVIHSDHGTQFTSWAFTSRVREAGLVGSMATIGDGHDNAMIESLWGTMQVELPNRKKWWRRLELANEIFEYIEACYNRSRRQSALN